MARRSWRDELAQLDPDLVAAYLESSGWVRRRSIGNAGSLWATSDEGSARSVLLPERRDLGDFAARLEDLVETLADYEERPEPAVMVDLRLVDTDVVRVSVAHGQVKLGTLPIGEAASLIAGAKAMITASACAAAAAEPRAAYPTRKDARVAEYLRGVRLGQTELGSYVITLLSPIMGNREERAGQPIAAPMVPFGRSVTEVLTRAVPAAVSAAGLASDCGDLEPFREAVGTRVSADLCSALAMMSQGQDGDHEVRVKVSWSPRHPVGADVPREATIPAHHTSTFGKAATFLREEAPSAHKLMGWVTDLHSQAPLKGGGRVTVEARVEGRTRRVSMDLGMEDYLAAIEAHRRGQVVECGGELQRSGNAYTLAGDVGFDVVGPD
jgi:hypothetical protein